MKVAPYTRPNRREDMKAAAYYLAAYEKDGTFVKNGIDLLADDIESRRAVVEMLEQTCHGWFKAGAAGHHAYSLPHHMQLIGITQRERAELVIRENRRAA